jgi:deoxyribose-phosphate aldolase
MKLASYIDHTILKAYTTEKDIINLCKEAIENQFYAVCINPCWVSLSSELVKNKEVKVATVIGFPLGATDTDTKIAEALNAIKNGANEIDMVINIGWLKNNETLKVENEIKAIKKAIGNTLLKVIIETCYLNETEKIEATKAVINSGAEYIKTSTGFGTAGATIEDIKLIKSITKDIIKIKASGGIKNKETALEYIKLGVSRIGTSNGIEIIK